MRFNAHRERRVHCIRMQQRCSRPRPPPPPPKVLLALLLLLVLSMEVRSNSIVRRVHPNCPSSPQSRGPCNYTFQILDLLDHFHIHASRLRHCVASSKVLFPSSSVFCVLLWRHDSAQEICALVLFRNLGSPPCRRTRPPTHPAPLEFICETQRLSG